MATAHNSAKHGDIAKTILLPGDPLRAQVIANTYLENPVLFNTIRNMYGFTGTFRGKPVSVMGTGMGIPSIGIYSYELIHMYGVRNLIRVGSCGSITNRANIGDIIMAEGACTDSSYAAQYGLPGSFSAIASFDLLRRAADSAKSHGFPYLVGNILSTDVFYNVGPVWKKWARMGCLGIEMETYALYCNAACAANAIGEENASPIPTGGVRALGIFTVSNSLVTGEETTAEERQNNFTNMIEVALDVAAQLE